MPACHGFVPSIEFDCLRELVDIVRKGQLAERKFEAIQHGSWFVGCGAAMLDNRELIVGSEPQFEVGHLNVRQCCDLIEERLPEPGVTQFDWRVALELIRLVVQLLRELKV